MKTVSKKDIVSAIRRLTGHDDFLKLQQDYKEEIESLDKISRNKLYRKYNTLLHASMNECKRSEEALIRLNLHVFFISVYVGFGEIEGKKIIGLKNKVDRFINEQKKSNPNKIVSEEYDIVTVLLNKRYLNKK